MKKILKEMLMNLLFLVCVDLFFAFVLSLIWNFGVVWINYNFKEMNYLTALGFSTLSILLHMFVNFWVNRYVSIKSAKALESIFEISNIQSEILDLKQKLKEKNIL